MCSALGNQVQDDQAKEADEQLRALGSSSTEDSWREVDSSWRKANSNEVDVFEDARESPVSVRGCLKWNLGAW